MSNRRFDLQIFGDSTKSKYIKETEKRVLELQKISDWELPELINYGGNYSELKVEKSAMKPFYYDSKWKTEKAFIDYLEQPNHIEWWFKNGDRDSIYFAVPYLENSEQKPFYVDFIVRYKDGSIGLFDTKSGITIKDAREKSDGLQAYLKYHNSKDKKLTGGIVTNTNPRNFSGRWMVYKRKGIEINLANLANWELLEM